MLFLRATALFLLLFQSLALASPDACQELLDPVHRARETVVRLEAALPGRWVEAPGTLTRLDGSGSIIATLHYHHYKLRPGHLLVIEKMEVAPAVRRRGLGQLLLARALLSAPGTTRIEATLAWTNAQAYFDVYYALPIRTRLFRPGKAARASLEQTPFFIAMNRLGFTRVIEISEHDEMIDVVLERPLLAK